MFPQEGDKIFQFVSHHEDWDISSIIASSEEEAIQFFLSESYSSRLFPRIWEMIKVDKYQLLRVYINKAKDDVYVDYSIQVYPLERGKII